VARSADALRRSRGIYAGDPALQHVKDKVRGFWRQAIAVLSGLAHQRRTPGTRPLDDPHDDERGMNGCRSSCIVWRMLNVLLYEQAASEDADEAALPQELNHRVRNNLAASAAFWKWSQCTEAQRLWTPRVREKHVSPDGIVQWSRHDENQLAPFRRLRSDLLPNRSNRILRHGGSGLRIHDHRRIR